MDDLVFESFSEFLNEDLGSLKGLDLPPEFITLMFGDPKSGGWLQSNAAGRQSPTIDASEFSDYKKFRELLKPKGFNSLLVLLNGKVKYLVMYESDRKVKVYDRDLTQSVKDAAKKLKESLQINEGRRRRGYWGSNYSGLLDSYSIPELHNLIMKLTETGEVTLKAVLGDPEREKKFKERRSVINKSVDPLKKDYYGSESQRTRARKYSEMKRLRIDKYMERERERLKDLILQNLEGALNDVISDIQRGYSFYADSKNIGEKIMKGVDLKNFQTIANAYSSITTDKTPVEMYQKLKPSGLTKSKRPQ